MTRTSSISLSTLLTVSAGAYGFGAAGLAGATTAVITTFVVLVGVLTALRPSAPGLLPQPVFGLSLAGVAVLAATRAGWSRGWLWAIAAAVAIAFSVALVNIALALLGARAARDRNKYTVLAFRHDATPLPLDSDMEFDTQDAAEKALRGKWPDAERPTFRFPEPGYDVAQALYRFAPFWASDANRETVWLIIVRLQDREDATKALRAFVRYCDSLRTDQPFP